MVVKVVRRFSNHWTAGELGVENKGFRLYTQTITFSSDLKYKAQGITSTTVVLHVDQNLLLFHLKLCSTATRNDEITAEHHPRLQRCFYLILLGFFNTVMNVIPSELMHFLTRNFIIIVNRLFRYKLD